MVTFTWFRFVSFRIRTAKASGGRRKIGSGSTQGRQSRPDNGPGGIRACRLPLCALVCRPSRSRRAAVRFAARARLVQDQPVQAGPHPARVHPVKRRCAVGPAEPDTGGSRRQVQPAVATKMIAGTWRSPLRRRPPPCDRASGPAAPPAATAPTARRNHPLDHHHGADEYRPNRTRPALGDAWPHRMKARSAPSRRPALSWASSFSLIRWTWPPSADAVADFVISVGVRPAGSWACNDRTVASDGVTRRAQDHAPAAHLCHL